MIPPAIPRWKVVSALGVFQIFAWGSSYYLPAPLAVAIAADTGWAPTWTASGLSLGLLIAGLASPRIGAHIGRYGGREMLAGASLLLALGLLILALSPTIWVFLVGWLVIGLGMGAGLYDAAFSMLGRLYGSDARKSITQLTLWGGFASTLCWPLSAWAVELWGWRATCLFYAALHLLCFLPMLLHFLPRLPRTDHTDTRTTAPQRLERRERIPFALIVTILTSGGILVTTLSVHLLTLLQYRGLSLTEAVAVGALIGPAQFAARFADAWFGAKQHPLYLFTISVVLAGCGVLCLAFELPLVGLSVVIFAAGNGLMSIARGTLPLSVFGPDRYPALMGRIARPALIAQAASPAIGAWLIAHASGSATLLTLSAFAVTNIILTAILWGVRPPSRA